MTSRRSTGEDVTNQDFESLSVSKRLVRSLSQKLRRNSVDKKDAITGVSSSSKCLALYGRGGGGCKVGADTCEDFRAEGKGYNTMRCGNDEATIDCFSYYGVRERFWRKNSNRKLITYEEKKYTNVNSLLPDDILEMCLVRLPFTSLMNARLVCKKWRNLSNTPRFTQIRKEGSFRNPWLFFFGAVKDGFCSGEVHAFDVCLDQWYKIDSPILKGRFLFSVASFQDEIYIVGGCSSLTNLGRIDRSSHKTHKGVSVFNPLTKSWRKAAAMKHARSSPILGVSEVSQDCTVNKSQQNRTDRRFSRSRTGGISEVYEDPHRLSVRRQSSDSPIIPNIKFAKQKGGITKFVMIAVGGVGSWDEPLDSCEIYDSVLNKWTEIQRVPLDFGVACSGVVCDSIFYVYSESDKLCGYDIEKGYWIRIQTNPFPPRVQEYYPKFVSCKGRVFMLSVSWCEGEGRIGRRNKAVRKLWELDLVLMNWSEVATHPDAPMDWNAAFVADGELIFGVEMFKIFGQVLDFVTLFDVSEAGPRWRHVSRNRVACDLDDVSCVTKSVAVVRL